MSIIEIDQAEIYGIMVCVREKRRERERERKREGKQEGKLD